MSALYDELKKLEGIMQQNPETGALNEKDSYLGEYTNRLFGAPFQLMDDVDKKFPDINSDLGNDYLRNIMLNSPIVHIRPGMPHYTGGDENTAGRLLDHIKSLYITSESGNMGDVENLLLELAQSTIFGKGSKLQRRMFGFRETYYDYMQHVNYMCRSVAVFLNLTSDQDRFPYGTFVSNSSGIKDSMEPFSTIRWENYRMLKKSYVKDPAEYLGKMIGVSVGDLIQDVFQVTGIGDNKSKIVANLLTNGLTGEFDGAESITGSFLSDVTNSLFDKYTQGSIAGTIANKVTAVEFMVEPGSFTESLENDTKESAISSKINSIGDEIGSEIGFITRSNADTGVIGDVVSFLGDGLESASTMLGNVVEGATGGFITNLFSGAIQSIKGQKMIYPEIYESSRSGMDYSFVINLSSPYGDIYNYYMNIAVPLLHLIALAAPRLVTANTSTSPYLIQCYIPGQCTCNLGIIKNLTIEKNPNGKRVSVNGFPLEVRVTVNIHELYNAMTISPANDPSSFLFNETLNDYLSNMAGLIPSIDTYTKQRKVMFENIKTYFSSGEWVNDIVSGAVEKVEDFINPFVGR